MLLGTTDEQSAGCEYDWHQYYFGARSYRTAYGRWNAVDALADSFPSWNAYNYVLGNPVSFTDPTGLNPLCPSCTTMVAQTLAEQIGLGRPQYLTGGSAFGHIAGGSALKALRGVVGGIRAALASRSITRAAASAGIEIIEREGSYIVGAFEGAAGEARFITEVVRSGDDLILRGTHIEGAGTLSEGLDVARRFGESMGVRRVIVEGGSRTTGARPGHIPRPITIEVRQ